MTDEEKIKRIKYLLNCFGLTQRWLRKALIYKKGVSYDPSYYSRLLRGERENSNLLDLSLSILQDYSRWMAL